MVRRWCREYPDALEDIKRAVKLNLLFYAAYNYVIVPEKAMMLRGLSINDDLLEEVAIGLDGKNPARGSGDWNTLNQWKQLKKMTVPQGEVSEPRERPPPPTREGAPTTLEEESRREEGVDETGPPGPDRTPEEYVTECFLKKEDLNVELLVWEVAVVYGLSEAESRALVEGIQNELRPNGVSAEKARPHVTVCPLCKRHGADTTIIMSQVGDPQLSQMTLEQFVMSTLQEVEE